MNETIVSVRGVSKAFGAVRALQDVSLTVQQGMVTAIVGDNGSGKSTLIQLLSGNLAPDSGWITVGGQTYRRLQVRQALDMGIRTVYQDLSLDACKNSYENIFLGQELRRGPFSDRRRMAQEAVALLQQLEIVIPDLTVPVRVLSGGQRQGVAIARAMRKPGSLLLLDEPTAAMGIRESHQTMALLHRLHQAGHTLLLVSHDIYQVFDLADRIVRDAGWAVHCRYLGKGIFTGSAAPADFAAGAGGTGMKQFLQRHGALWLLIGFCFAMGLFLQLRTGLFFAGKNLTNVLEASSFRLLLAIGMTFIIAAGAIDLSVGAILSLSAILAAKCMQNGMAVPAAVLLGLLAGTAMGTLNGALVHFTGINAFIITLATSLLYRGLALVVTLGTPVSKLPEAFRVFGYGDFCGMERGVSMAIVVLLLALPLLYKMRWGHYIMTLGSNPMALRRSGVRLEPWRISAFALMGFLSALAGMIITARLNSAEPNAGLNMEMDAITAVIMGGTPLHGGQAALIGTTVAVLLLSSIRNGLTLLRVSSYYQQLITGVILLCAVITAELRQRRQRV